MWGYFVLPILHGDRLIGRADLAMDRKAGRLVAHAVHREPDAPRGKAAGRAVRRELERLASLAGRHGHRAAQRPGRLDAAGSRLGDCPLNRPPSVRCSSIARPSATQAAP